MEIICARVWRPRACSPRSKSSARSLADFHQWPLREISLLSLLRTRSIRNSNQKHLLIEPIPLVEDRGPMTKSIEIGESVSPTHLDCFMFSNSATTTGEGRVRLEVYSGSIPVNEGGSKKGGTRHDTIAAFLPIHDTTIRDYQRAQKIISATVTVAPSGVDDDATVFAVDRASVKLENQKFVGVADDPLCLVLRARIGVNDGTLLAITYQVNILTDAGAGLIDLKLELL